MTGIHYLAAFTPKLATCSNTQMLLQLVARFYENYCYHFSVSKHVAEKDYGGGGGVAGSMSLKCYSPSALGNMLILPKTDGLQNMCH